MVLASTLLNLLQPPYAWILCLVLVLPYWILFVSVLMSRFDGTPEAIANRAVRMATSKSAPERELSLYAAAMTSGWLLIVAFKVYQQFFAATPIPNSSLGLFDFGLGLFSLASWMGLLLLRAQKQAQSQ